MFDCSSGGMLFIRICASKYFDLTRRHAQCVCMYNIFDYIKHFENVARRYWSKMVKNRYFVGIYGEFLEIASQDDWTRNIFYFVFAFCNVTNTEDASESRGIIQYVSYHKKCVHNEGYGIFSLILNIEK